MAAAWRWLGSSPSFLLSLGHGTPRSFFAVAPDQWPGNAAVGQRLLVGEFMAHGIAGAAAPGSDDPPWRRPGANALWLEALNAFGWLRDLRDCGDAGAAALAVALVDDWIDREGRAPPASWQREVLAGRMVEWIRHFDWLASAADADFAARFVHSLARQRLHLKRLSHSGSLGGHEGVAVLRGLVFADLAFLREGKRYEKSLEQALARLAKFVKRYVLHDGVVAERAPYLQVAALRHLIDVRAALASAEHRLPAEIGAAIDRLAPMLRFFRHGDGGLALFNGTWEGDRSLIDLVLARSGSGEGAPAMALASGFQRLAAGTSVVIADAGSPPGRGLDGEAHAGTLSFEMSAAHERLIVNCGIYPGAPRDWRHFMRFTAAHSTAVVDDTNSSEITDHGALEYRAGNVLVDRAEDHGAQWLDMSHDGYRSLYGMIHRRRLWLSADGGDLRGEDTFSGPEGKPVTAPDRRFIVRFHLHPAVKATLAQSGQAVLMRLPSGRGWRLRASGAGLGLAESIYLGEEGRQRRTEQIVLVGQVPAEGTSIKWALTRMEG
jgi:uncharacterized heparinase superfamily protein